MYAILCKNIVYLYGLIDVFLCKNLYRIALFLWMERGKYCGKVWENLSDLWCKCDVVLSVWCVVFILFRV